ncbi:MAG: TIM barrel protein [Firmicutes bacterium]|nr:TIM barrel protein [Bacillota bacterium]
MAKVAEQIPLRAELPRKNITGMRFGKRIRRHWALYLLMIAPLAFLITFSYVPMVGAQIAFRDYNPIQGIWNSPWIGMQEVDFWIQSPYFWPIVTNTLVLGLYSLAVGTPAAIILALALNEVKLAFFKRSVQLITFAPYFISAVVLVSLLQIMLAPTVGPFADLYRVFGLGTPPDLFASPSAFPSLYVWSGVWQTSGYGAVVYLAALSNASPELYEAARIDGASRIQRIIHVDWPVLKPTVIILFILTIGTVLAACAECGIPLIRIMAHLTQDEPYLAQLDAWRQRLSSYVARCEQYGVRIGVQPHYGDCVADVMSLLNVLEPCDPRWIGAVWDAAHDGLTGVHPEFTLDAVWDRLYLVNLKNAVYVNENGPEADTAAWHRYFTDGRHGLASWPRIASYLQRRGYDGVVCLTAEYDRKHEVDRLAALDLDYARSLFGQQGR